MEKDYALPTLTNAQVDMNSGFLCFWTYWQPDPSASDPDMPGVKQQVCMYHSVASTDSCLCGSGKSYGQCCQRLPYWQLACANPGLDGYSLLAPQSATFSGVDSAAIYDRLMEDRRLNCVEDSQDRVFWNLWGEPALESKYGIICFGDIELHHRGLSTTAMSAPRMEVLLDLLDLGSPTVEHDSIPVFDKQTRQRYELPPPHLDQP